MSKKEESITSIVLFIVLLAITTIAILIRTHVIIIPDPNPDGDRSFFDLFKNQLDFQTLAEWASILGLPSTLFFGFYAIYTAKKSKEQSLNTNDGAGKIKSKKDEGTIAPSNQGDDGLSQSKKNIIVTSIEHLDKRTMVVNLKYKGSSDWAKQLAINVSENDICSLMDPLSYPQDVKQDSSFVVKLDRHGLSNDITKFSVRWKDQEGTHEEVKEIDFETGVEIKRPNNNATL